MYDLQNRGLNYLTSLSQNLGRQSYSPSNYVMQDSMNTDSLFKQDKTPGGFSSFLNKDNIGLGINALQGLGNLYLGFQSMEAMNKNNKFNRSIANRNLANSSRITNAALEDRAISKATGQGIEGSELDAFVDDYLKKYRQDGSKL